MVKTDTGSAELARGAWRMVQLAHVMLCLLRQSCCMFVLVSFMLEKQVCDTIGAEALWIEDHLCISTDRCAQSQRNSSCLAAFSPL